MRPVYYVISFFGLFAAMNLALAVWYVMLMAAAVTPPRFMLGFGIFCLLMTAIHAAVTTVSAQKVETLWKNRSR